MASPGVNQHHLFTFPLSPPSSGSATAASSPRLHNITTDQRDVVNQHFTFPPTRQNAKMHLPPKKLQKPPVVPDVLHSEDNLVKNPPIQSIYTPTHTSTARSFTLPPDAPPFSVPASAFPSAVSHRTNSASSSSTSSSASVIHMRENPHTSGAGMGRKVAAKLQLFKESVGPTEEALQTEASRPQSSGSRRVGSSQIGDDEEIAEAEFKFVKRSEWPDREAAAIRRERSMTTLERVKAQDSILGAWEEGHERDHSRYREGVLQEYNRWRRGFVESSEARRGRRRDRAAAEAATKGEGSLLTKKCRGEPIVPRPGSHTFPPSPSPSRSPRRSSVSQQSHYSDSSSTRSRRSHWPQPQPEALPSLSLVRSETHIDPLSTSPSAPVSPIESTSPWSTDDDSNWETASVATSASVQTRHQEPRARSPILLHNTRDASDSHSPPSSFVFRESDSNQPLYFDLSQENLPHIPLRPFRNQVGGHSSIYKFTKQAVCKVRVPSIPHI